MYAINLSWEKSNDILSWAAMEQAELRITVRLAREWTEVPSRFYESQLLKTITVQKFPLPFVDKLLTGQLLPCSFRKGNSKLLFVSAIVDQKKVLINGREEDAFVLAWPEGLQQIQRRMYHRASVPADIPLQARFWGPAPFVDKTPEESPIETGRVVDISVGGAQIEVPSQDKLILNRPYLLQIELPEPEDPVLVQGQVRRMETVQGSSTFRFGMQFMSLGHTPKEQQTMTRIAEFANYIRSINYEREQEGSGQLAAGR